MAERGKSPHRSIEELTEQERWNEIGWPLIQLIYGARWLHAIDVGIRARIKKGYQVLEIGAGYPLYRLYSGKVGKNKGGLFHAIDINERITERSIDINRFIDIGKDNPSLDVRTADAIHLPFDDESMDVVIASNLYSNDNNAALREAYRVLKPGGRLVTSVFAMPGMGLTAELRNACKNAGFQRVRVSPGTPFPLLPIFWNTFVTGRKPREQKA